MKKLSLIIAAVSLFVTAANAATPVVAETKAAPVAKAVEVKAAPAAETAKPMKKAKKAKAAAAVEAPASTIEAPAKK